MKKKLLWISVLAISALCACNTTGKNEPIPTPTMEPVVTITPTTAPTNTPRPIPTRTEEHKVVDYLNSFDKIDCTDIESFVNKEDSIRNSNLLNYGFLTYDTEGNIYYVNENDGNIYKSDSTGENK